MSAVSFNVANNNRALSSQSKHSQSAGALQKMPLNNLSNAVKGNPVQTKAQGPAIAVTNSKDVVPVRQPTPTALAGKQIVQGTANLTKTNNTANKTGTQNLTETNKSCPHGGLSIYDAQTIRENMRKAFLANPHVNMDDEAEYYETVRRLDVCGHCWAEQQKYAVAPFKLKEKGPSQTLYQKDFVKHPIDKGPVIKNDFYNTFSIEEPMDFGTTMRQDYKPYKVGPVERHTMLGKSSATGVPFAGRSGYKTEYIGWGNLPVVYEKAANNVTIIPDLPFVAKTAYQENFVYQTCDQAKPMDRDLWKHNARSPISPGIPFLGVTSHNSTFKPYKVGGNPLFVEREEYEPTEAYPDQFRSTYKKDFNGSAKTKCPAKVFMETHAHPKQHLLKP